MFNITGLQLIMRPSAMTRPGFKKKFFYLIPLINILFFMSNESFFFFAVAANLSMPVYNDEPIYLVVHWFVFSHLVALLK